MSDLMRDVYLYQAGLEGLDSIVGTPVIESRHHSLPGVFRAKMVSPGDPPGMPGRDVLVCRDAWMDIRWPLFVSDQKKLMRADLRAVVRETNARLFGSAA